MSLERPAVQDGTALGHMLEGPAQSPDSIATRVVLRDALNDLPPRLRHIVFLRFYLGRTQQEIGDEPGVTQAQVSRLLTRALGRLRAGLCEDVRLSA